MVRTVPGIVGAALAVALSTAALAANNDSPDAVLKRIDARMTAGKDQYYVYAMTTSEAGKADRSMTFEVTIKGTAWRRVEFLSPGDVKGTRILVRSNTQMYVYLPAFRKIRRIASHVKEQGFMGSAWDHDEFALAVFGEVFEAKGIEDKGDFWTLTLDRRDGQDFVHAAVELDVRKDIEQPFEIRYLNATGKKMKTEYRKEYSCGEGFCSPRIVDMVDHTRNDIKTRMERRAWKVNQGVPDSFFTVRALQRGA